jgi:D-threonate/D-erythronate kinase
VARDRGESSTERQVAIVADDFTSAMDSAAPFVTHGRVSEARVLLDPHAYDVTADLVAIDADSRCRGRAAAVRRVQTATAASQHALVLLKTVDSTLRGHVRDELEAAWRGSGRSRVVVAPAFPAAGRVTRSSIQLVNGVDVAASPFATDARHPTKSSNLLELLSGLGAQQWTPRDGCLPAGNVIVADAETDDDLDVLVAAVPDRERVLWIGSPGLAAALARSLPAAASGLDPLPRVRARRIVVVIGSRHIVNVAQLDRLRANLRSDVRVLAADEDAADAKVAVLTPGEIPGSADGGDSARITRALAKRARMLVENDFDALIVTGGETARAVAVGLGVQHVEVVAEPSPGIVHGRLPTNRTVTFITKAGGFGDSSTLVDLCAYLTGGQR